MGKLKHQIKSRLQHWGWFTQLVPKVKIQFFPTGKRLAEYLLKQDKETAYNEFKRLTAFIADAQNTDYYEALLTQLYPNRTEIPKNSKFVSKAGRSNRNRILTINGKDLFEKNYSHLGFELESIQAFEGELADLASERFRIPRLQKSYSGEFSSLLYFDYLELETVGAAFRDKVLIERFAELYRFSLEKEDQLKGMALSPILLDYEKLFYKENIEKAHLLLKKNGISAEDWKLEVDRSKRILSHGDLHIENVYARNTLIDLDNFGYYPIGMDAAFIYMFYFEERKKDASVLEWGQKHFQKIIREEDWTVFERNYMYYLWLFLQMRPDSQEYVEMEAELVQFLKSKYN